MNRKRGAQPGNLNAIKHGFYSDQFRQAEKMGLSRIQQADLTNEIQLFRVQLRRYLEAETVALDQMDYETRLQALHTFSLAAESFNRLVRTQAILNSKPIGTEDEPEGTPPLDEHVP
jgi:hypothetical protein